MVNGRYRSAVVSLIAGLCAAAGTLMAAEEGMRLRFSTEARPVTVRVSGTVTDAKTGQPIANARVRGHVILWGDRGPDQFDKSPAMETVTGPDGRYRLEFIAALTATGEMKGRDGLCVYAGAPGYETLPRYGKPDVTEENRTFSDFNFSLGPGKRIAGTVKDSAGLPVEGAVVRVQNSYNGDWNFFGSLGRVLTDKDGRFEVWIGSDRETVGGDPWLCITKPAVGAVLAWDILAKEDTGTLMLTGGDVVGKVLDAAGSPVADCEVQARQFPGYLLCTARTDREGHYVLKGIPGDPSIVDFFKRKNGPSDDGSLGAITVYARVDPNASLKDCPRYRVMAKDGQTVATLLDPTVSGELLASKTLRDLGGLMVRLDRDWETMARADTNGRFYFPSVSAGRHTLTAYLPHNLRYDRGIGRTQIDLEPGKSLTGVQIQLEDLAELMVQVLDASGNPLPGITAGATWSSSGDGQWTEGTVSDNEGWASLCLYAGGAQYVKGVDPSGRLTAEAANEVSPKPGQVMEPVRITMLPVAAITARLLDPQGRALATRDVTYTLTWADKSRRTRTLKTSDQGEIEIPRITPGIVSLAIETVPSELAAAVTDRMEVQPGQTKALADVKLQKVTFHTVPGRLLASETFTDLSGFKIRLDLKKWEPMVATDAQGRFVLTNVPDGQHRLTAYLPFNLRTDRGVGHTTIEVKGKDIADAQLGLETLSTIRMTITDESGKPLEGISAAAWWTKDHSGVFTEGTKSDGQGRATLYLYPGEAQYVGAHDWSKKYTLLSHTPMTTKKGQMVEDLKVVMKEGK
jgi:protocatechuate 3,4-dioxygenase beta subunit